MKPSKPQLNYQTYKVRIFRADGNFHVAAIGLSVTVADLGPVLDQRLLKDKDRESHRLYLKERGRGEIYFENLVSSVLMSLLGQNAYLLRRRGLQT
jgi:hypothetical protein